MAAKKRKAPVKEKAEVSVNYSKALEDLGVRLTHDVKEFKSPYYLRTGLFAVDFILGDEPGIPVGVAQFYGGENSGKTTAALQVLESAQKKGLNCFYFNQERAINESLIKCFPNLDAAKVNWATPPHGEACLDAIKYILRNVPNSFIVLDSIPACQPQKVLESESGSNHMAALARLITPFVADVKNLCYANNSVLLMINQVRANLDMYSYADNLPGGKALGHNCDLIVRFKVRGKIENSAKDVIGHTVEAETMKNRFQGKGKKENATLIYGEGFSEYYDVIELGTKLGIIERNGSWFVIGEQKVQGMMSAMDLLKNDSETLENIKGQINDMMS